MRFLKKPVLDELTLIIENVLAGSSKAKSKFGRWPVNALTNEGFVYTSNIRDTRI